MALLLSSGAADRSEYRQAAGAIAKRERKQVSDAQDPGHAFTVAKRLGGLGLDHPIP